LAEIITGGNPEAAGSKDMKLTAFFGKKEEHQHVSKKRKTA